MSGSDTSKNVTAADFPLAEKRPESVRGARGKPLSDLTLESVLSGDVTMEDLRITAEALRMQAQIARDADRVALAENFERAAEMTMVPQDEIMAIYEKLRPGRARGKDELHDIARKLRDEYDAPRMAAFVEEAAGVYEARGLFRFRF